jgi:hypothetical protein
MSSRKRLSFMYRVLLLLATGTGLPVWSVPTWAVDQEQAKSPRALLQVAATAPQLSLTTVDNSDDYNRYLQTQLVLIKSCLVIDTALQQPAIAQLSAIKNQADPIAWLQQNLEAINVNHSEVVQVSLSLSSGASGKDQSAITNAVVSAYVQEAAGAQRKRQAERHSQLKKIKETYEKIIQERRETARRLSESVGNGEPLSSAEQKRLVRRHDILLDRRLKLRLDRAEAETLLERRKKAANRESDPVRKELAQLEDRLAILTAHERVLQDEQNQVAGEKRRVAMGSLELKMMNEELVQLEDTARRISTEVERLNIELDAAPRVRIIENAVPPKQ